MTEPINIGDFYPEPPKVTRYLFHASVPMYIDIPEGTDLQEHVKARVYDVFTDLMFRLSQMLVVLDDNNGTLYFEETVDSQRVLNKNLQGRKVN